MMFLPQQEQDTEDMTFYLQEVNGQLYCDIIMFCENTSLAQEQKCRLWPYLYITLCLRLWQC